MTAPAEQTVIRQAFDLIQAMPHTNLAAFAKSYEEITGSGEKDFPWTTVFREAAAQNDLLKLGFLKGKIHPDSTTLTAALHATINSNDNRGVAHRLQEWGADTSKAFMPAFQKGRAGIFEELVLWTDKIDDGESFFRACLDSLRREPMKKSTREAFRDAARLYAAKEELRGKWGFTLRKAFAKAVEAGQPLAVMAAYAESRQERFWRGKVNLGLKNPHLPADGLLLLLKRHHPLTATRMMEDGCDPTFTSAAAQKDFDENADPQQKAYLKKLIHHYKKGEPKRKAERMRRANEAAAMISLNTPWL